MTGRALLRLDKRPPHLRRPDSLEWLVTNGLGGYAAGVVQGMPLRRFHGWLVAALPPPHGRVLLLQQLQETVLVPDSPPCDLHPGPGGHAVARLLTFFLRAGLPHWCFDLGHDVTLERMIFMPHDHNTVHIRYRLRGAGSRLRMSCQPWLDIRPHEGILQPVQAHTYESRVAGEARFEFTRQGFPVVVGMMIDAEHLSVTPTGSDWNDVLLQIEHDRGYDSRGSVHTPGTFWLDITSDRDTWVTVSCEPWTALDALPPEAALAIELTRRERLLDVADPALRRASTFLLTLAADQFLVRPASFSAGEVSVRAAGAEPRTVIAGYHWFTDWGRDTMIALEGLTMATGRLAEARNVLQIFAHRVHHGLIPNLVPEGEQEGRYHTADATLWFFHALARYEAWSADDSLVHDLLPTLEDIFLWHQRGTLFSIRVDRDGLLTQGVDGLPLTWMDARVDGWVVTPRRGKAVEINALWYNALTLLERWLLREGRGGLAEEVARSARRCRTSFNRRFWNGDRQHLFDVVDGEFGDDHACRPNQIVAISVPHSPLEPLHWRPVFDAVARELLTPVGLRTLAPSHPDYKPHYFGDLRARDAAYHQGTVWPWLIGPFIDAWMKLEPGDAGAARSELRPLLQHLMRSGCVGSISEIFDAESPYTPRGCVAQAWSVAEVARALVGVARGARGGDREHLSSSDSLAQPDR